MWPAIAAGAGALGSGVMNFLGQNQANNQNWDQFVSNQIFNQNNINAARTYDYMMSNTAVQRRAEDLKKAGFNPMLAMEGQAAGGGSSPITNAGVGNAIQPNTEMGKGINTAINSAMAALNLNKDLKLADKEATLKGAQALAAGATAQRENSQARLNSKQERVLDATFGKTKKEAELDLEYLPTRKLLETISQGSGIARDASFSIESIMRALNPIKGKGLNKIFNEGFRQGTRAGSPIP